MRANPRKESIVPPDDGGVIEPGPARMRILEDGVTPAQRLDNGEITLAPRSDGHPSTGPPSTTRASRWCPAPPGSLWGTPCTTHRLACW